MPGQDRGAVDATTRPSHPNRAREELAQKKVQLARNNNLLATLRSKMHWLSVEVAEKTSMQRHE
jgi:ABC-type cobalamin transport system ATPase subunit